MLLTTMPVYLYIGVSLPLPLVGLGSGVGKVSRLIFLFQKHQKIHEFCISYWCFSPVSESGSVVLKISRLCDLLYLFHFSRKSIYLGFVYRLLSQYDLGQDG